MAVYLVISELILFASIQYILGKAAVGRYWGYLVPVSYILIRLVITIKAKGNILLSILAGLVIVFLLYEIFSRTYHNAK